mgnify:CR=1 FL=1
MSFLPITKEEMTARGWEAADFVYVTGDAYVDHPSFGAAIITRLLEHQGYRVAVLAQPRFDTPEEMTRFGRPRLGFLVSGGNIDSMVAHYTAARRLRSEDFYSPRLQGRAASRPCHHRLLPADPRSLWRYSHRHRRTGGVPAPICPL